MSDTPPSRAFGLRDLLVLIAIGGVSLTLLAAGVVRSWAAYRTHQCRNNLRQIGIALQSYHSRLGTFPPGYQSFLATDGTDLGPGWGWAAFLMDDLGHPEIRSQINFKRDLRDASHRDVRTTFLAELWCPADRMVGTFPVQDANGHHLAEIAHSNYIAMNGNQGVSLYPGRNDGAFLRNRAFKADQISDGLANTIFIGERSSNRSLTTWTGVVADGAVPAQDGGYPEMAPALVLGHAGLHVPNHPMIQDVDAFASKHPYGVNFLFGDGRVRQINYTIAVHIYDSLATRAGRETVSLDEL